MSELQGSMRPGGRLEANGWKSTMTTKDPKKLRKQPPYESFDDIPDDEFEETYRVNVFGMFRLCKTILPKMKEGGSIINTASIQPFDPSPTLIAYAS
jgi:NAD(P)-dependent dehydrogenase (short-subunit alcohol dehydrogenase family)